MRVGASVQIPPFGAPQDDSRLEGGRAWIARLVLASGTQLLLEPDQHPAARAYASALHADGIPAAQFEVADIEKVHAELVERGARIVQPPTEMGPVWTMVVDDTCGNLIQLATTPDM